MCWRSPCRSKVRQPTHDDLITTDGRERLANIGTARPKSIGDEQELCLLDSGVDGAGGTDPQCAGVFTVGDQLSETRRGPGISWCVAALRLSHWRRRSADSPVLGRHAAL